MHLSNIEEQNALHELEKFLKLRVEATSKNQLSEKSVENIFDDIQQENDYFKFNTQKCSG